MPVTATGFAVSAGQVLRSASSSPVFGASTGIAISQTVSSLGDTVRVSEQIGTVPAPSIPVTARAVLQTPEQALAKISARHPYMTMSEQIRDTWNDIKTSAAVAGLAVFLGAAPGFLTGHSDLSAAAQVGAVLFAIAGAIGTTATLIKTIGTVGRYLQKPEPDGFVYESEGRFTDNPRPIDKVNRVEPIEDASQIVAGHWILTNRFVVERIVALPVERKKAAKWLVTGSIDGKRLAVFPEKKIPGFAKPGDLITVYGKGNSNGDIVKASLYPG